MPCSLQDLLHREKNHLCITCAKPAAWLEKRNRHGVYCERHRKANIANFKKWKKRTGYNKSSLTRHQCTR